MKKVLAFILFFIFALFGCTPQPTQPKDSLADWPAAAKLDAEETPEELYTAALGEGMLVVYSVTSRVFDVVKSFEKQYPGLTVFVHDIRGEDAIAKLNEDFAAGDIKCDVVLCSDTDGVLSQDLKRRGILFKYVPYDIKDKLSIGNDGETLCFVGETEMIFYNSDIFANAPIQNWWELTEEKWNSRIYMPSPFKSMSNFAFMSMMIKSSDKMEKAYIQRYGKKPDLSQDESVGKLFIRLLYENSIHLTNTADECVNVVGASTADNPALAIMVSSKLRMRDVGYEIMPILDVEPFTGLYTPNSVMIAGGAKNVNTAKLFIRWLLGEADGQGEGNKPYLQNGAWSVRNDVTSVTAFSLEELNLLFLDTEYIYQNKDGVRTFLSGLINRK